MDKYSLLKRYWGYDTFRPLQEEIVDSVTQGHDTMVLLPTGGGKSLCYQLPALLRDGLCLVVSPLIALMKDQVQQLNDRKLKAACLVSGMDGEEATKVLYNAMAGQIKFLYVSPERLRQRRFIEHFRQMKVGLIAVDEAHCVSQWGYDFRPPYLQIAEVRAYHPEAPLVALTATATLEIRKDIIQKLQMRECSVFCSSFLRPNLSYEVLHEGDKLSAMLRIIRGTEGSGIVYVRNRRATRVVAQQLENADIPATFYHAGLETAERDRRQQLWMKNQVRVMVATNAFGMGIDKPDVRFVLHLDVPDSLEAYFQEAGRAGRDGRPAVAAIICDSSDREKRWDDFATGYPSLKYIRNIYRALCNYYQLPLGGGLDARFDFDLETICETYKLRIREFYNACKFLEREGLIALPEREEMCSTLYMPVSREELYRFQVDHQALGNLLQAAIRLYPGLSTEAVPIDEAKIASRCFMEPPEVMQQLTRMNDMHVVEYHPHTLKPQVIFLTGRVNEKDIYLDEQSYDRQKEAARLRLESICRYVENDRECRSRQLLAYFGEQALEDCGCCDVCRKQPADPDRMRRMVLGTFEKGRRLQINELLEMLKSYRPEEVRVTVRALLDEGVLQFDEDLRLMLV